MGLLDERPQAILALSWGAVIVMAVSTRSAPSADRTRSVAGEASSRTASSRNSREPRNSVSGRVDTKRA